MKTLLLSILIIPAFTLSSFAGNRYQQDGIAFEEYLRQQQIEDALDAINAKLDALNDIQTQLNDLNGQ